MSFAAGDESAPPIAVPDDLATFLRRDVDTNPAVQIIGMVQRQIGGVIPGRVFDVWPRALADLAVRVAARAYSNPLGAESETTGPFTIRYSSAELTEADRVLVAGWGSPYRPLVRSVRLDNSRPW